MRRSVLLVCYYFPPLGLGGVTRPLTLFKQLPDLGWDCDVLTVKPVLYRAYEPELLDRLDCGRIFRSGSRDPQRLLYLLGVRKMKSSVISSTRAASSRFFPDSKVGWVKPAVKLGRTLCENNRYSAIISSSPPLSAHLVGRALASDFSLPWIADFRDYWTAYKIERSYTDKKMHDKGNRLLKEIQTESTIATAVNDTVATYVGAGETISNGYDDDLATLWRPPPDGKEVTIGLLGHQHDPSMVRPLVELLVALREKEPKSFARLNVLQVGQVDHSSFLSLFAEQNLDHMVEISGRLPRTEAFRKLSKASLFYIGVDDPAYLPGRTFDMLASGRPLLVYAEENSEYARLIANIGNGCLFDESSMERGVLFLSEMISAADRGEVVIKPRPDYARQYSGRVMAERFAALLERIT